MQFHVTLKVHDSIVLDADKQVREVLGRQIQSVMASGKVTASGFLAGIRGGFFIIDIDTPEELYALFGPEVYSTSALEVHPIAPVAKVGELFQQWAEAGR